MLLAVSNPVAKSTISFDAYARGEERSDTKHEWLDGEVFAMAGGTPEHAGLAASVLAQLVEKLAGKPCRTYTSDLRIRVQATGLGTYPDATVICGKLEVDVEHRDTAVNPKVIVEVLSASTESYDRGQKFVHYKQIPSLEHYVLVSSDRAYIEWFSRAPEASGPGAWIHRAAGAGEQVTLSAIECTLSVDAVYFDPLA
jgi:Uma2 family endonuclease